MHINFSKIKNEIKINKKVINFFLKKEFKINNATLFDLNLLLKTNDFLKKKKTNKNHKFFEKKILKRVVFILKKKGIK